MASKLQGLTSMPPVTVSDCNLTSKERAYVYWRGAGLTPAQAAKNAGFSIRNHYERSKRIASLEANPNVRKALNRVFEENRVRYQIDRDNVVEGLLEAINVAREQSDSPAMINGWKELARVTGVGAPERKEILLTQSNPSTEALKQAPDDELLKLVGKERNLQLASPIEDADFYEVPNAKTESEL